MAVSAVQYRLQGCPEVVTATGVRDPEIENGCISHKKCSGLPTVSDL